MRLLTLALVTLALGIGIVRAEPVPIVPIRALVESADLIIAGNIKAMRPTGTSSVESQGRYYSRLEFEADITVDETIKGESVPRRFILAYSVLSAGSAENLLAGGLTANAYGVIFLKKTDEGFAFVNPYSPSLPGTAQSCGFTSKQELNENAYQRVLERVLNVLCTNSNENEKRIALGSLNWDKDSTAAPLLKAAIDLAAVKSDPVLRTTLLGDLLRWSDLSVLPSIEDELFNPALHTEGYLKSNLLLVLSGTDPQISIRC